jgi:MOSC domain-containing protein YiiM
MERAGRVESINASRGGVPKTGVFEGLITENGLDGDRQGNPRIHGGPDRAVSLYSLDVIHALRREGHPIGVGSAGENLTLSGLEWSTVVPGAEIEIGEVRLLVTKYASPCESIAHAFLAGDSTRISQKLHPGWSRVYCRVLSGGLVRVGDPVSLIHQRAISAQ